MARYVVVGAGAIGTSIAVALASSGYDVHVVVRAGGARHTAMQVEFGSTVLTAEPSRGPIADLVPRDDDRILLAVQSQDTMAAVVGLSQVYGGSETVFCCQNGVENEAVAARFFPSTVASLVVAPTRRTAKGVRSLAVGTLGILDLGPYGDVVGPVVDDVVHALVVSGFDSRSRRDVMPWKYRKLVRNCENAVTAVLGTKASADGLRAMVRHEAEACLAAAKIPVVSSRQFDSRVRSALGGISRADLVGSTSDSMARGASTETDYLNGEVVRLGSRLGVPTPTNRALQLVVGRLSRAGHPHIDRWSERSILELAAQLARVERPRSRTGSSVRALARRALR